MQTPDFLRHITTPTPCGTNDPNAYVNDRATRQQARSLCAGCPVLAACRSWAVDNDETGVWGGTTTAERGHYQRTGRWAGLDRVHRPPVRRRGVCGTPAALKRHQAVGESCEACRVGVSELLAEMGHGTARAYRLEVLLGVVRCGECREWCRVKSAAARAARGAVAPVEAEVVRMPVRPVNGRQAGAQRLAEAS